MSMQPETFRAHRAADTSGPPIAFLVNPRAAAGRLGRQARRYAALARSCDLWFQPADEDGLLRALADVRASGVRRLAVAGGDGTLHRVAMGLDSVYGQETFPTLGLLGGGTINTIQRSLGLYASPQRALRGLLDARDTVTRLTLRVGSRVGFIFGVGAVPTFLEAYYETGAPSVTTAAKVLGRIVSESLSNGPLWRRFVDRPRCHVVTADGEGFGPAPMLAVAAGTIQDIGLGFKPFRGALVDPGKLSLVVIHGDAGGFVADLPRLQLAAPMRPSVGRDVVTESFEVSVEDAPPTYVVDGDLYRAETRTLRVSLGPSVTFARPAGRKVLP